jgi:hypothetical protein
MWVLLEPHDSQEPVMQRVTTIGFDIAKSVFKVHGVDAEGKRTIERTDGLLLFVEEIAKRGQECRVANNVRGWAQSSGGGSPTAHGWIGAGAATGDSGLLLGCNRVRRLPMFVR